jgi:hypothetical protein
VRHFYSITTTDLDNLDEKVEEEDNTGRGDYWKNSRAFLHRVINMDEAFLSEKERPWVEKILEVIQKSEH